ncbi:NAD(P)/FAD-dependent oxidoreductase [Clostridium aciditolerans]|uniref:NADH:ubiquinone reductase (non-electrogenic) n=1 Tax=Clostridium aciditolerans TaxID=339861 RepID=A0A934M5K9_9CLOT|nr:NAD(P)/FAD-dependent oxidoreductase [Clostridium aciditolerans]MBI6875205.1 NAD(P)/FAD-dependent oxidoreductase [Clostridium aciditolerans]
MSTKKKIVIIGGGYGGVLTAKKLAKKFGKDKSVEITLIDKKPYHTLLTELHEVAANRAPEESIRIDLKKIFAKRNVNVVLDEIVNFDFKEKTLKSENNSYDYDYLVIGTGSKPTYFGIPGAEEYTQKLWSYEDAVNLKEHILNMFRQAVKEPNKEKRQSLLTFVVVGGGFTGIEMIGELGEWKNRLCKEFYIDKEEVKLYVVDAMPKILPIFPDNLIKKAEKRLEKLDIEIITGAGITEVTKDSVTMKDKGSIKTKTVVWAAGVEGADLVGNMELQQQGRKRIVTNDKLQAVDYENVYVVGDNIFYIPEGEKRPVPQMVENAEQAAPVIANNIYTDIRGGQKKSYKPGFHGAMVCIGGRYGVAHIGMPGKFIGLSGFLAMFVKHFINMVYFFQVAGFNKCWSYLIHEFFHVKDKRSFVGGHFAKSSPNFWLVPLRIFVGYKWLEQGLHKLPKIIEDPSNIFLIPAPPSVDGNSAASAAKSVAEAATQVATLPVPEFLKNIVDWSMNTFFYTGDGGFTVLAKIFQTCMVVGEVVVGILLIAGLFSALASIASIVMGTMVWSSGMAPYEMLWYLGAGVALIGGSGSVFGLDCYVLPVLKKYWKKIRIVKKYYLYTD